jgi:hypothetical protein
MRKFSRDGQAFNAAVYLEDLKNGKSKNESELRDLLRSINSMCKEFAINEDYEVKK